MPTYEYKCKLCGHELEELQSMKDEPLVRCPACGKDGLKRLIGGGGAMIFKGSGFYLTDYKNSTATPANSSKKPSEKKEPPAPSAPDKK